MADLATQIRDYVETTAPAVEIDMISVEVARRVERSQPFRVRRGLTVALASATALIAVFAGVLWVLGPGDRGTPPVTAPSATLPTPTVPDLDTPPTPTLVEPETPPPTVTSEQPGDDEPVGLDYAEVGDPVGMMDLSSGPIEWWTFPRVPVKWVNEGGFPSPSFTFKTSWIPLYESVPEGVEIFEVADGYVGLQGSTADEAYAERDRRATAMWYSWTEVFVDAVWFSPDGESWELMLDGLIEPGLLTNHEPYMLAERDGRYVLIGWSGSRLDYWSYGLWDGNNPLESTAGDLLVGTDGEGNPLLYDDDGRLLLFDGNGDPVDPDDVTDAEGNPVDVAAALERGEVEIRPAGEDLVRGAPMAWVSDDLVSWERVTADFEKPGMITAVESVVATEAGWFAFGSRRTDTSDPLERRVAEWAAWASPDGKVWEEFPIADLLGAPTDCKPSQSANCIRIKGEPAPDGGVAVYAYDWSSTASDIRDFTWKLIVGFPA